MRAGGTRWSKRECGDWMSQPDRKIAEQAATIYAFVPKHKLLRVASVVNDNDEC